MKITAFLLASCLAVSAVAQDKAVQDDHFTILTQQPVTAIKNQSLTGTCWCFSTTSLVESQCIKNKVGDIDLSEMFTVRNIYLEKAYNYIQRQGHTQFGEGGLGHDMIRATALYGAMPEAAYSGLLSGQKAFNHVKLVDELKHYLDSILAKTPVDRKWIEGYTAILDKAMGTPPESFEYEGKTYNAKSFATAVLKFNPDDYVFLTSFINQPFYKPYIVQVPDNFSNGAYYNLPMDELIETVRSAVQNGYTAMWDADVSNRGFNQGRGVAVNLDEKAVIDMKKLTPDIAEESWNGRIRQELFDNLTTQDDHLMHIYGLAKSPGNKPFFLVKNSWGETARYKGSIYVSEAYFAVNTITIVLPKAALNTSLLSKLKK